MKRVFLILSIVLLSLLCMAQEQKSEKEREKEFYEAIQTQVDRLTDQLDLEDWQIFYTDSILTHDFKAMRAEMAGLSAAKVGNSDLFYDVQDKWMEQIYNSMHKILDEKQWAQYLKSGAARDKKQRDKRAAKKSKQ